MRQLILFIGSVAALFGTLFLIALSFAMIAKGSAGYGLAILLMGTPCALGMAVVFDYIRTKLELSDNDELDVDIIRPKFTKFGGGS